jgi:hypothetical protein
MIGICPRIEMVATYGHLIPHKTRRYLLSESMTLHLATTRSFRSGVNGNQIARSKP